MCMHMCMHMYMHMSMSMSMSMSMHKITVQVQDISMISARTVLMLKSNYLKTF